MRQSRDGVTILERIKILEDEVAALQAAVDAQDEMIHKLARGRAQMEDDKVGM